MKKSIVSALLLIVISHFAQAQTKVFKEVSDEISSQLKVIRQDNALVGYLVFARLERATEDSFNYRVTIMDENLNDIGKVDFREQSLTLQDVSFEQDVLCLAYLKSNFIGNDYKGRKEFKAAQETMKNAVFTQFLNLEGKILKTNSFKVDINTEELGVSNGKISAKGALKHDVQLKNITQKGFALFYGDNIKNNMIVFNTKGDALWQKKIKKQGKEFYMLASGSDLYFLYKNDDDLVTDTKWHWGNTAMAPVNEGGYQLLGYSTADTTIEMNYSIVDAHSNQLKVLSFDNDPVSGKPYISGSIINPEHSSEIINGRQWSHGPYSGLFTINVNGPKKADIKQVCSYWSNGSQPGISDRGLFTDNNAYGIFAQSFRDYDGNTYFIGSELIKRTKWGSIASSVILSPLVIPSIGILAFSGTAKCKITDVVLVKQNGKGSLSVDNTVEANHTSFYRAMMPLGFYYNRSFYRVTNSDTKTNYVIVDDKDDIFIYNVAKKKLARTIPHKDGHIKTEVFPAKEGYIMVSEYNKKEKYTKFSIEAL